MQEKEISVLLAFTITCEGDNSEFPLHWDGIEISSPASSLRVPKVQPKVPVPHQNKRGFAPIRIKVYFCAKGLSVVTLPSQTWGAE